jgi:hypothetical protein
VGSIIIEPVNGPARNAECLPRPDFNWFSVHGPCQHSFEAVDCLFVMVVAMRRTRQALATRDNDFKSSDAASGVESSPVSKKCTESGPRWMVSSDGLTRRSAFCVT